MTIPERLPFRISIPRSNSSPDLSRENYQANSVWMHTEVPKQETKIQAYEQFLKEARRRQFRHVHQCEPKLPSPKK